MTQQSADSDLKAPLSVLRRVDAVCLRFEDLWKEGKHPRAETFLAEVPAADRAELLPELLLLEWCYLLERGESYYLEEYAERFLPMRPVVEEAWRRWKERNPATSSWSTAPPEKGDSPLSLPTDVPAPFSMPGYERIERIGRGGMGEVYRAYDPGLKRLVAIKVIRAESLSADAIKRFRQEGEALARLQHPHIAQVFAWHETGPRPALIMEYVSGGTLQERLGSGGLSTVDAIKLTAILARAVQAAHAAGIVHRDLKPGNVLMGPPVAGNAGTVAGGFPKVTDFGLARLIGADAAHTAAGLIVGTPTYMSPEQANGQTELVGPPADVWALGVILYRCLAGRAPFIGDSVLETLERIKTQPPPALRERVPGVPEELERVCLQCLARDPAQRPTAAELAQQMEELNRPLAVPCAGLPARKPTAASPTRGWVRLAAMYASVFLLTFAVVVCTRYWPGRQQLEEARRTTTMQVRIWRPNTRFQALVEALPIVTGDELQIRFTVPKGRHTALYLVNAKGQLQPLERYPAQEEDHDVVYPGPGKTKPLQGPPGTEMILVVSRADGAVTDDEVNRLWGDANWPVLQPDTVIRLRTDGVGFDSERPRDLGETRERAEAEAVIQDRLAEFRDRLALSNSTCEGVAFGHQ